MRFRHTVSKDPLQRIPPWAVERLNSCPAAGTGVNDWLFSTAGLLWKHLSDPDEIADLLIRFSANCGRVVTKGEIDRAIRRSSQAERPSSQKHSKAASRHATHTVPINKIQFEPTKLAELAAKGPKTSNWRHWLWERSPLRPDIHTGVSFLRKIFREGETALVFDNMRSAKPSVSAQIKPSLHELPDRITDNPSGVGSWFLSNPVDGEWHPNPRDGGKMSCRSEEAVTAFRYAVLESDQARPDHWFSFLVQLPMPITAIYTSGGRSIHTLLRVDAVTKAQWDEQIVPFKSLLKPLGADAAAMTAVRLTRLPGCWRREKGGFQKLLYLNPDITTPTPIAQLSIRETRDGALQRWRGCHSRWQNSFLPFL